jgi:riboflavin kinase/FMN adenylyltransferase
MAGKTRIANAAPERRPAAATIGVFDGVHRGHQALLARVVEAARSVGGVPVVVTFARHPLAVLAPERCPEPLTTGEERWALLTARGITEVVALDFDRAMSELTAREFLERVLLRHFDLRVLVVGPDFAMGRGRRGDRAELLTLGVELGFTVEEVTPVLALGKPISSTRLRQAIAAGDVAVARELLGRDYVINGPVVQGHGRGSGLGFATANLAVEAGKMLPADGVYAAFAARGAAGAGSPPAVPPAEVSPAADPDWLPAVVNIGRAPTFGGTERRVEVHVLDLTADLRGERLQVRLVARLRGEVRFPDAAALVAQIRADVDQARRILWARSLKAVQGVADRSSEE